MIFGLMYHDLGLLLLRIAIGIIFVYHGWPKIKNPRATSNAVGLPVSIMTLVAIIEFFGGIAIAFGFYSDIASFLICVVMLGATYMKIFKWHTPFSAQDKMGWEFDLILFAACLGLLMVGSGSLVLIR